MSTILIVDDNKKNLQVLGNILVGEAHKVAMALDGPTALQLADKLLPDLIVLDIMMPGMDGYEVCQILKKTEKLKEIPVIFLTAKIDVEDIVNAFHVGGVDYVTKPFKKEELLARINNQLQLVNHKRKIEEQARELMEANQFKNRMFSIIGHDLRGSIGMLKMSLDMILTEPDEHGDNSNKNILLSLSSSTEATYNLLENLLFWGKSESGRLIANKETIDIVLLVNQAINLLNLNILQKNISIVNNIPDKTKAMGDVQMIQTVFRNLLSNAIKFTPNNGTIVLSTIIENDKITIAVSDNGVGIPAEDLKNLFGTDNQIRTKGTNDEPGSGLGLILCKDFIIRNNGELNVESTPGKGSTFSFTLPAS